MPRPAAMFDAPFVVRHPAPLIAEHTRQVLQELGLSAEELNRLAADKVIRVDPGLH